MEQPAEVLSRGTARLRRWRAGDVDELYRVVSDCLDHLRPWMPWAAGYDRTRAVQFLSVCDHDWDAGVAYNYAILSDGAIAGSCGLMGRVGAGSPQPSGTGGFDIGYWLHPAHTGRGLATAAAAALVEQAFALPGIDFVTIRHDLANTASGAIPRRLGFEEAGRRDPTEPEAPGETGVLVVWRLTREQAAGRGIVHAS